MSKCKSLRELTDSIVLIGTFSSDNEGEKVVRVFGTGFIFNEKYVISSHQTYANLEEHIGAEKISDGIKVFNLFGNERDGDIGLHYIDNDEGRDVSVFEINNSVHGEGEQEVEPVETEQIQQTEEDPF